MKAFYPDASRRLLLLVPALFLCAFSFAAPITITNPTLTNVRVGVAYTGTFTAANGTAPYSFAITAGSLPAGMALSSGGVLSGKPTAAGTFTFSVTATDVLAKQSPPDVVILTVLPAIMQISPVTLANGTYGTPYSVTFTTSGGTAPYTYTGTGLPPGLSISNTGVLAGTPTAAGTYTVHVTSTDKSTGTGPFSVVSIYTLVINKVPLTIQANNALMAYATNVPPLTYTITGFVNGDNASKLTTQPSISTTGTKTSNAGTYPITVSGAVDPNYIISYVPATLRILPRLLTVVADDQVMNYGGTVPALTVQYYGWQNGDGLSSLTNQATATTAATSSSPAGYYSIDPSGASSLNYTFTYISGTLTINPDSLTVTANPQTKIYGAADPAFTYSVTGLVNGDNNSVFSGSLSRDTGENVGIYAINIGTLSAGNNYLINFTGNNLTINKAPQQINWTQGLLSNCSGATQVQLTATSSSGLPVTYASSDTTVASLSGDQLTFDQLGTAIITASQPGDSNHLPATPVFDTVLSQSSSLVREHWNDALFFDNTSNAYVQWQWYKNGTPIQGATGQYYSETPSLNGQYYVIATDNKGQHVQTCPMAITGGGTIPGIMKAIPNPVNKGGIVTIISNYDAAALQGAQMQIVDITGRVLKQITNVQPTMQVSMPSTDGIYIVNLLMSNGQKSSVNVLVIK